MRFITVLFAAYLLSSLPALAQDSTAQSSPQKFENYPITEIAVFKVSDPKEGLNTARAVVADAQNFGKGIAEAHIYQSGTDPHIITQVVQWRSLKQAKAASAAAESFPHMARLSELITEEVFFDYFWVKGKYSPSRRRR